jgi:F-type H+-transporting ATPase subunit epsilon
MAEERTFPFEVLTLQKAFLSDTVRFVIAPGQEGVFEILAGHAPYVFALKPGPLRMRRPDGTEIYVAVAEGFLIVQQARTTVLTRSAERPEEIDRERALRAKERAEQRLQARTEDVDMARAQAALQRAIARLQVTEYVGVEK